MKKPLIKSGCFAKTEGYTTAKEKLWQLADVTDSNKVSKVKENKAG